MFEQYMFTYSAVPRLKFSFDELLSSFTVVNFIGSRNNSTQIPVSLNI